MKKVIFCLISLTFILNGMAFAGSQIKGAIINKSNVKNAANIAIGKGNKASIGSIGIKNSCPDAEIFTPWISVFELGIL